MSPGRGCWPYGPHLRYLWLLAAKAGRTRASAGSRQAKHLCTLLSPRQHHSSRSSANLLVTSESFQWIDPVGGNVVSCCQVTVWSWMWWLPLLHLGFDHVIVSWVNEPLPFPESLLEKAEPPALFTRLSYLVFSFVSLDPSGKVPLSLWSVSLHWFPLPAPLLVSGTLHQTVEYRGPQKSTEQGTGKGK